MPPPRAVLRTFALAVITFVRASLPLSSPSPSITEHVGADGSLLCETSGFHAARTGRSRPPVGTQTSRRGRLCALRPHVRVRSCDFDRVQACFNRPGEQGPECSSALVSRAVRRVFARRAVYIICSIRSHYFIAANKRFEPTRRDMRTRYSIAHSHTLYLSCGRERQRCDVDGTNARTAPRGHPAKQSNTRHAARRRRLSRGASLYNRFPGSSHSTVRMGHCTPGGMQRSHAHRSVAAYSMQRCYQAVPIYMQGAAQLWALVLKTSHPRSAHTTPILPRPALPRLALPRQLLDRRAPDGRVVRHAGPISRGWHALTRGEARLR